MRRLSLCVAGLLLLLFTGVARGQQSRTDDLGRALEHERAGRYDSAAAWYSRALIAQPGDPSALLGLERSLEEQKRGGSIVDAAREAIKAQPVGANYSVLVRGLVTLGRVDSAMAAVRQWAALDPREPAPYRELVQALQRGRNRAAAREAIVWAREETGRREILAYDMAQVMAAEGNWAAAAREWVAAARDLPGYRQTALAALTPAPDRARADILSVLEAEAGLDARLLESVLRARWGGSDEAVGRLVSALPADRARAVEALSEFADQMRALPGAQRARGVALEEMARRSTGETAARARVQAAQAYQLAGDTQNSRRLLGAVSADTRRGQLSASAASTMIEVLVADGKLDDAEAKLNELRGTLNVDEWEALRLRVADGWIGTGSLDQAERLVAEDSSVAALDVRGRIAVYRGDLKTGVKLLRAAGPYAISRVSAVSRTTILALVQPIEDDSVPALGQALLQLERGDTSSAAATFEGLGTTLPASKGGAELSYLAGTLLDGHGDKRGAERLYRRAEAAEVPATSPAASLALAHILLESGRKTEAVSALERLILRYPESAIVPQARRALDEAKGMVPPT